MKAKAQVILGGWKNSEPNIDVAIWRNGKYGKRYSPTVSSASRINELLNDDRMEFDFVAFSSDNLSVFYFWNPTKG